MSLHPQAEEFLRRLSDMQSPPLHEMSPDQARRLVLPIAQEPERVGGVMSDVVPTEAGDVPIRGFFPLRIDDVDTQASADRFLPIVVYFHGGGWVLGSIDSHEAVCRRMANAAQSLVISVDYRLAPEHKFPAAVDDCLAVTQWAFERGATCGGDPARLFVCGDSAGGNLAAAVCLRARDEARPPVRGQILIYPITDHAFDRPSYHENAVGYQLTTDSMRWFWNQYLDAPSQGAHPWASPIQAVDHTRLPPTLMVTAGYDPLRDEGIDYAARLSAAGVPVTHIHYPDMIHGFFRRLDAFDRASELVRAIADWISTADDASR
ncbi:MAG: alpha/beta hydrolase [Planctomycetaceae bacterium]|nr:alpha/beta hydrolase [Planctomycetaceae bacterium]